MISLDNRSFKIDSKAKFDFFCDILFKFHFFGDYNNNNNYNISDIQTFFDNLGKTRADRALRNAGGKIFKNYNRKGINELRYYFNRWRNF